MSACRKPPLRLLLSIVSLLLLLCLPVRGAASETPSPWTGRITTDTSPLAIRSESRGDLLQAEVSGLIATPFAELADTLAAPANWCEIAPLSLNIKACTHRTDGDRQGLTFYAGRKIYQSPEDAYRIDYRFHLAEKSAERLWLFLFAAEGPMGTSDYRIELEAVPAGDGTRIRIASAYRSSLLSRMAVSAYLATLGRHKVGFSRQPAAAGADPEPVRGLRGVIERNAMRSYLALQAFLENRHRPQNERFAASLDTWFDLTERYPRQLHEMDREEYLETKRRERGNQIRLQRRLDERSAGTVTAGIASGGVVD